MVKNPPAMQETVVDSWVRKIPWRRDRLSTPVFLGFPGGSDSKESSSNAGDLGLIPGLGRFPWRRERLPTPVFWPGEFHGLYSPWVTKSQTRLSDFRFHVAAKTRKLYLKMNEVSHRIPSTMPVTALWIDVLQLCLSFVESGEP